jgi:hypothetical protein
MNQNCCIDLKDKDGNSYTISILIKQDLGKNEIFIIEHINGTQKSFKKITKAMKYFKKKKFPPTAFKRVINLNNKIMRLRDSEKFKITPSGLSLEISKEIKRKNTEN